MDRPVEVDTFNGNVVLVSREASERIGAIDGEYDHAAADHDYGFRAVDAGVPMLLSPGTVGTCPRNPSSEPWADPSLSVRDRFAVLVSRKGHPPRERARFLRRHGGPLWPVFWLSPYIRALPAGAVATPPGAPTRGTPLEPPPALRFRDDRPRPCPFSLRDDARLPGRVLCPAQARAQGTGDRARGRLRREPGRPRREARLRRAPLGGQPAEPGVAPGTAQPGLAAVRQGCAAGRPGRRRPGQPPAAELLAVVAAAPRTHPARALGARGEPEQAEGIQNRRGREAPHGAAAALVVRLHATEPGSESRRSATHPSGSRSPRTPGRRRRFGG